MSALELSSTTHISFHVSLVAEGGSKKVRFVLL